MINDFLKAIPFGVVLSLTIGPVFFVLLETSATKGFKSALIFDCGVILADVLFILVAFFSTSSFLDKIKDDTNLFIFGGVLLIAYGTITFVKTSRSFRDIVKEYHKVEIQKQYGRLFLKGFLLNFINIGVLLGWVAFILLANTLTETKYGVIIFLSTIVTVYFLVDLIKIGISKKLRNKLTPKVIFKAKKIVSLIILVSGVFLLSQGLFPKEKKLIDEKINKIY